MWSEEDEEFIGLCAEFAGLSWLASTAEAEKPIYWIGPSLKDLLAFPETVRKEAGYQLHRVQNGLNSDNWKPFQAVGAGTKEIRISEDGNACRVMYVAKFSKKIYVLHSFQKKFRKTSSQDINIAKARYNAILDEGKI